MITKFDTSGGGTSSGSGSGKGMGIMTWLLIGVAAYAGYRFILKPYLDKKNQNTDDE
jgi:hypothetical protein